MPDDERADSPPPAGPAPEPPDPALAAAAAALTPERLVVLPFYHELRNAIVKPERVKLQTEYFWQRWVPLLGPTRSLIVMRMRQYGYFNRQTRELRDECARTYDEIAASLGISTRSLERYFESEPDPAGGPYRVLKDPLLARFIRLRHQYVWRPGKSAPERTTNEYKIAMDEPLTPADETAFRLAAARRLAAPPGAESPADRVAPPHTRHSGAYGEVTASAPAPARRRRQSGGYVAAPPERHSDATDQGDSLAAQPVVPSSTSQRVTTTDPPGTSHRAAGGPASPAAAGTANKAANRTADEAADAALAEAVASFEAANDRPTTPLERRLLAALAADFEAAARAQGADGPAWVAAAVVEAVESGSRFVAPRRLREICRRWAAEGRDPERDREPDPARRGARAPAAAPSRAGRPERASRSAAPTPRSRAGRPAPTPPPPAAGAEPAAESLDPDGPTADAPAAPRLALRPGDALPGLGLTARQLWAAVLEELRPACPPGIFATWLRPTRLLGLDGEALVVGAPNSFARQWLEGRLGESVAQAVAAVLGGARPLRFAVGVDEQEAPEERTGCTG